MQMVHRVTLSRRTITHLYSLLIAVLGLVATVSRAAADEAQWIWSPAYEKEEAPAGTCYFRKTFNLGTPEQGEIQISADDKYELFVNGQQVGTGQNWKVLDVYDIKPFLVQGANTISVKATNSEPGSAGLVARVIVKEVGNTHVEHSTDETWKTALKDFSQWQKTRFDDSQWLAARAFGRVGTTLPWGNEVNVAGAAGRFKVLPEFRVEWVVEPEQTGSLIAMAFDEFGQIIASRENGPLVIVRDEDNDGLLETAATLCEEVKNCQGILTISGKLYVIGEGPQGVALYRLSDEDQDGKTDRIETLLKFQGEKGEHGPHALSLGPDGLIYIVCGNFAHPEKEADPHSPHRNFYEGDLIKPKYEDAGGHAVGVKAPGGTILRTDTSGSVVELVAGGFQNPYDICFNREGDLFTADSDMEWDLGMPWYRPTRVNHVLAGGEFGWRSGWSKWPDYYFDSLPPLVETGRGSPTGVETYNHFMYPARYHNAVFMCDWSRGRIMAVKMKQHGATYKATTEVFVEGRPLNVTDIAVAPDGWLYFCTGGRDTEGGIYRIVWDGRVPETVKDIGTGLKAALRQPQLSSAWARQKVALIKQQLSKTWASDLTGIAQNASVNVEERVRALELMQLFGPAPTTPVLTSLVKDKQPAVRAKVAYLLGVQAQDAGMAPLGQLLLDDDPNVQRLACEAIVRTRKKLTTPDRIIRLLPSADRHVAWAARRALERMPIEEWENAVLTSPDPRIFLQGSLALLVAGPTEETIKDILDRCSKLMKGYLSDQNFIDLLRVTELSLACGGLAGTDVPELTTQLSEEYPSQDIQMNRELVKLLVYLQAPTAADLLVPQLENDIPSVEKMQIAMHVRFLQAGWTIPLKLAVLEFYENAREMPGGHSFAGYLENVSRDFFAGFNDEQRALVLADGAKWPTSALSVLAKLENPSPEIIVQLQQLDRKVKRMDGEAARRLRIGIAAVLAASKDPVGMTYLRELFETEPDRRVTIAMCLAQQPHGDNWPLLVRSLSIVEGAVAQEVLGRLATVDQIPSAPEPYRQVIIRGLMLGDNGGRRAVSLLEKWTGERLTKPDDSVAASLAVWQKWFMEHYPDEPEPKLPVDSAQNHWTYQELLSHLSGPAAATADPVRGAAVFEKAQCIKCHRFGDRGEGAGPDLTTVSQRFQRKEILESILYPSQVISDQYASRSITTTDGRVFTGMAAPAGDGAIVVLQANAEKVLIPKDEIAEVVRSKKSAMPDELLNKLTIEEVADLFAFLQRLEKVETANLPSNASK